MTEVLDTIIISDVHLGASVSKVKELTQFLKYEKFKRLILLGDTLDSTNLDILRPEDWEFLNLIKELSKDYTKQVILIRGNHDEKIMHILEDILKLKSHEKYFWTESGRNYLAIHGDQFDKTLINNPFVIRIGKKFYFFLQYINLRNTLFRVPYQVRRGAIKYAEKQGIDVIFCGHTHEAGQRTIYTKDGKKISYYNSGCWTKYISSYITIKDQKVEVKKHRITLAE